MGVPSCGCSSLLSPSASLYSRPKHAPQAVAQRDTDGVTIPRVSTLQNCIRNATWNQASKHCVRKTLRRQTPLPESCPRRGRYGAAWPGIWAPCLAVKRNAERSLGTKLKSYFLFSGQATGTPCFHLYGTWGLKCLWTDNSVHECEACWSARFDVSSLRTRQFPA